MRKPLFFEFIQAAGKLGGTGLIFSVLLYGLAIYEHNAGKNAPASYLVAAGTLSFCWGSYVAWLEERNRKIAAENRHGSPNFEIQFGQLLMQYHPSIDTTSLCISAMVINTGEASIAVGWRIRFQSPTLDISVGPIHLINEITEWVCPDDRVLTLVRSETLPARTIGAIGRGDSRHGRFVVEIPGNRLPELNSGAAELWVGFNDAHGRISQAKFEGYPATKLQSWDDERVEEPQPKLTLPQ